MDPKLHAALAALLRQYLEQTTKGTLKSGAKETGKSTAKALPKGTKIPPIDVGTIDANFWSKNAPIPYAPVGRGIVPIGPQGIVPSIGPQGIVPGMTTGDWLTPGAAATAIGTALLLRQMTGSDPGQPVGPMQPPTGTQPQSFGPLQPLPPQSFGPAPTSQRPQIGQVPALPRQSGPVAPNATSIPSAIAPQIALRTPQSSPQLAVPTGQVPVPQGAPPNVSLSFWEQLGRPEIYGMLGQLAQAIAPGSFGAGLGGFAANRAQGILTNQALMNLLQSNPTLGLSDVKAGTLGPQAVASLGQQALQYDLGNDQTAIRAFEAESPEQRLAREYLIATSKPQANGSFKATVTVNEKGQFTPGQEHLWLFDEQGNRIKYLGGQAVAERAGQSVEDLAGKRATQLRLNLESARKEALTLTAMEFKEIMIADPNDPANFVVNPYAPPEALARFKQNYIRAVQDRQDNEQLPDNLAILGEVVRKREIALPTATTPGPVNHRGSFNDIK